MIATPTAHKILLLVGPFVAAILLPLVFHTVKSVDSSYGQIANHSIDNFSFASGHQFNDYQGRYLFAFFGYQGCSQSCPRQLLNLLALAQQPSLADSTFVYVDLAPNPHANASTASLEDNAVHYQQVTDIAQTRRLSAQLPGFISTGYQQQVVDHSAYIYLIDPQGVVRRVYGQLTLNLEQVINDLNQLQQESML
ncbi:SCO family protein [Aliagarivorans marinus]|uniref:SCO family protein n=1 Tax=Aliagarivorans marinus TaxID=561965 RepID=UPI00146FA527